MSTLSKFTWPTISTNTSTTITTPINIYASTPIQINQHETIKTTINDYTGEPVSNTGYDYYTNDNSYMDDSYTDYSYSNASKVYINDGYTGWRKEAKSWPGEYAKTDWKEWGDYSPPFKIGDIVDTPMGTGKLYGIEDEIYCVELDPTSDILHEFTLDEIKKNEQKTIPSLDT